MLHDFYFSSSVFFYIFFNPPAAIWKMEEPAFPCFLHEAGCQCNDLRLLRWALCMFFFSIFQQHSFPQCIVTICVKKRSPLELWFVFKRLRCWKWQCYSKCPNSLSSQVILFSSLPGLQNLSHKIIYLYFFIYHTHNVLHTKMIINSYLRAKLIMKCVNRPKTLGLQNPTTPSVFCFLP